MNKVVVILFSSAILFGCDRNISSQNDLMQDATNFGCNSVEAKLSVATRDESDVIFYDFQKKCEADLNENIEKSCPWIKILMLEGMPYAAFDWGYFQKRFGKYLSPAYNSWLIHLAETEKIIDDALLLITPDELRQHIIFLEHLSEMNHNFVAIKDVKSRLSWYLDLYLNGSDNSPVFDKHGIRSEFRTSYEKFLSENKNSKYYSRVRILYDKVAATLKANPEKSKF